MKLWRDKVMEDGSTKASEVVLARTGKELETSWTRFLSLLSAFSCLLVRGGNM